VTSRVFAVGGEDSFRPLVARALLSSPESIGWVPDLETAKRILKHGSSRLDLVVLGPNVSDDQSMVVAQRLGRDAPSTAVVVVRSESLNGSFPKLIRAGIRDVVDLSAGTNELEDALRRALEWSAGVRSAQGTPAETAEGVVVSVFSTKGGTGKTFLSCNLAAALADKLGGSVALLDLDHDLGDVFAYFNAEPRRALLDLVTLPEGADAGEIVRLGTPLEGNVVGFGSPPDPRAQPFGADAVARMIRTLREAFPFVVIDSSTEYTDHVLAAFDASDVVCFITGLDVIGVRHLSLGLQTLETLGIPRERYRVVLNRADSKVDLTATEIERILGIKVDARIPSSPLVPRSINHGRLVWFDSPRSDVAKSITQFAEALSRQFPRVGPTAEPRRRGMLKRS
jgi:pilus assembly protein CpaE